MYRIFVTVWLYFKYEWFSLEPDSSLGKYQFPIKAIWFFIYHHLKMNNVKTETEVTSKSCLVLHEVEFFSIYLQTTEKFLCKTQKFSYMKEKMKGF